jgi:hypothetical protein
MSPRDGGNSVLYRLQERNLLSTNVNKYLIYNFSIINKFQQNCKIEISILNTIKISQTSFYVFRTIGPKVNIGGWNFLPHYKHNMC